MNGPNVDQQAQTAMPNRARRLPPRWFIRLAWVMHRALYGVTGGRVGLRRAAADHAGLMRLRTIGRRSGKERRSILGYVEDGPNLVTLAMNGWADPEPAWWLNLEAQPNVSVDLVDGPRLVRGRAADPDERARLWSQFSVGQWGAIEDFAKLRSRETAVVILEPRG